MESTNQLPLAGVRILDITTTIAGPSATRILADFGAEVIKIESTTHPDTARLSSPYANGVRGLNSSGYFGGHNAGKLSMALNLRTEAGVAVLAKLVQVSDVLVESFAPGVMRRLGLTDQRLREWNRDLVIAHHSLQGQAGPRSRQRGYGQLASAMTGWFALTGLQDQEPVGPYSAYTDFIAWPYLSAAILLALESRDRGAPAATIDHTHMESSAYFAAAEILAAQRGDAPRRHGNRESYAAPSACFRCADDDDWCAITVSSDEQWQALCMVLGRDDLQEDPRFVTAEERILNASQLEEVLALSISGRGADELERQLSAVGVPASRVARASDLFEDSQLEYRGVFRRVPHDVLGEHAVAAPAFAISGIRSGPTAGFPLLGEHTERICTDVLRLDAEAIAQYAAGGAFE